MIEAGSALEAAYSWLDGVVANAGDPDQDAGVWILTNRAWRYELAASLDIDPDIALDAALEDDVARIDGWEPLARSLVRLVRETLPETVLAAESVCFLDVEPSLTLDTVQVVFNEQLTPGRYSAPTGTRIGFAVNATYEERTGWWTIAGVVPDWHMPQWLAELANA